MQIEKNAIENERNPPTNALSVDKHNRETSRSTSQKLISELEQKLNEELPGAHVLQLRIGFALDDEGSAQRTVCLDMILAMPVRLDYR